MNQMIAKYMYGTLKHLLKELQNYNRKMFLCPPQIKAKTQPTIETAIFASIFTLWHISLKIYI